MVAFSCTLHPYVGEQLLFNLIFRRSRQLLQSTYIGQRLFKVLAAQFLFCFKGNAYFRPLWITEQRAEILRCKVEAASAGRFPCGHSWYGTGNGNSYTTGSAARSAFHIYIYNRKVRMGQLGLYISSIIIKLTDTYGWPRLKLKPQITQMFYYLYKSVQS